jgi:hypothetical protein
MQPSAPVATATPGLVGTSTSPKLPATGPVLLVFGFLLAGTGVLMEGAVEVWFFGGGLGPLNQSFRTLEWVDVAGAALFGIGILLGGAGWTLWKLRDRRTRSYSPSAVRTAPPLAGYALVLSGAFLAAVGQFVYAGSTALTLEGVLSNMFSWTVGAPGLLEGFGLLVVGAGVVVLWQSANRDRPVA